MYGHRVSTGIADRACRPWLSLLASGIKARTAVLGVRGSASGGGEGVGAIIETVD